MNKEVEKEVISIINQYVDAWKEEDKARDKAFACEKLRSQYAKLLSKIIEENSNEGFLICEKHKISVIGKEIEMEKIS